MKIAERQVGGNEPCFLVAEAGLAHDGKVERAKQLIDRAAEAGFDAVKFQAYITKDLIDKQRDPVRYKRFAERELSFDELKLLSEYAKEKGIIWFATPHTESALELLKRLNPPCYKVGSGERGSPLLDRICSEGKPTIISTGMRTHLELFDLVDRCGNPKTAFLHCITVYPTPASIANIASIKSLKRYCSWNRSVVGYSDHTSGTTACEIAVAVGAKIIEKHICLEDSEGQDTHGALKNLKDMKNMVKAIRNVEVLLGREFREYSNQEKEAEAWAIKSPKDWKRPC